MKNERGEIVTGVMIVMMAGMMIFGMFFMHGGHGGNKHGDDQKKKEQKHEHGAADRDHMHMQHDATDVQPASGEQVDADK